MPEHGFRIPGDAQLAPERRHARVHAYRPDPDFDEVWTASPAIYLQWLGYEAERRPDVLYGYPNVIASYPLSGFVVPSGSPKDRAIQQNDLRYDFWDSHRDMISAPMRWTESC